MVTIRRRKDFREIPDLKVRDCCGGSLRGDEISIGVCQTFEVSQQKNASASCSTRPIQQGRSERFAGSSSGRTGDELGAVSLSAPPVGEAAESQLRI